MKSEPRKWFSRSLHVGLGISAVVHVGLVAGYAALMADPDASADPATTPDRRAPPALEVVRLPEIAGPPAEAAPVDAVLASEDVSEATESPRSPRSVSEMLVESPTAADLSLRMAGVAAPLHSELTALPAGAVRTRAGQVDAPTGADGWFPGKYTLEHEDHEHPVVNGFVLGIGQTCGFSGIYTSVNRRSPFGG